MSLPECKQPFCGCDFEQTDYDNDKSYCTDTGTPKWCEVPEKKCKYSGIGCKHVCFEENDRDEENGYCMAIRDGVTECPYQVYEPEGETWTLQETITKSPHWNFRGFKYFNDLLLVDEKIIRVIKNWAADSTEPNMSCYKDPEAMFNALDLIYKLLDEAEQGSLTIENKELRYSEPETVHLKQIVSVSKHRKR